MLGQIRADIMINCILQRQWRKTSNGYVTIFRFEDPYFAQRA